MENIEREALFNNVLDYILSYQPKSSKTLTKNSAINTELSNFNLLLLNIIGA